MGGQFSGTFVSFLAGHCLVSRRNPIRRREFTLPSAAMATVDELAAIGFPQAEHLLSRLPLDMLIPLCVGNVGLGMAPMFKAHT
jgi:hypothetical protein